MQRMKMIARANPTSFARPSGAPPANATSVIFRPQRRLASRDVAGAAAFRIPSRYANTHSR
jgi:hypothetical protein